MKNIRNKALLIITLSLFAVSSTFAKGAYFAPSKTKPDISGLVADAGCKYVIDYNPFMQEYTVQHICNTISFPTVNTPVFPAYVSPLDSAPVYTIDINVAQKPSVNVNVNFPAQNINLNTNSFFNNFYNSFRLPVYKSYTYDFSQPLPVFRNYNYTNYTTYFHPKLQARNISSGNILPIKVQTNNSSGNILTTRN